MLLMTWRMFAESVLEARVADISVVGFGIRVFVCFVVVCVCVGLGVVCVFWVGGDVWVNVIFVLYPLYKYEVHGFSGSFV